MTAVLRPAPATAGEPRESLLRARQVRFSDIPRSAWDRLFSATRAVTPFSRWTFHRAWWDAYGPTAHEQYLVCSDGDDGDGRDGSAIRAIVPLMHRHEVEPDDAATATSLRLPARRQCTDVAPTAKAVFFGASYHADYATILAAPTDMPAVARAVVEALAAPPHAAQASAQWDVVDLRRLREVDPALEALETAFRAAARTHGWDVVREQEDVCPVLGLEERDWNGYLGRLDRKTRHEIRRKIRRAEGGGELRFLLLPPTDEAVDAFIALHQERWGEDGLFRPTEGGERSRRFLHALARLEMSDPDRQLHFGQLTVNGRLIFTAAGFDDGTTCYFYNAGMAPNARDLAPGITGTAAYLRDRLEAGRRRFDFLRGDEPYKYEWGAVDEPIYRLLVTRRNES